MPGGSIWLLVGIVAEAFSSIGWPFISKLVRNRPPTIKLSKNSPLVQGFLKTTRLIWVH
jgi:hypothetical protein